MRPANCKALLVYPPFAGTSFWNYRRTYEAMGAKYSAAPLGFITLAALLPPEWEVRLVNMNTEEFTDSDLEWADVVMTGGMLPQRLGTHEVMRRAKAAGKPVVVGGPDATCEPKAYEQADFCVLGEAEEIIGDFLAAWARGDERGTFVCKEFPDITRSPLPRFDLLKLQDYVMVGVQYARGCPFDCEFCNVVDLNGRKPRVKTDEQMLRELQALYDLGYRGAVDFVDDNMIGNRKQVKPFLRRLREWNVSHGHPFEYSTEASLDLADDDELMELMRLANFYAIFVGIETPSREALVAANKRQNARRDIVASVHKIHRAGIFANAGFIIGFDKEPLQIADAMVECVEESGIPICMTGLLYALPGTKLERRLIAEGRLLEHDQNAQDADQATSGLNFKMDRPRAEVLRQYRDVVLRIYEPKAFYGRVRRTVRMLDKSGHKVQFTLRNTVRDVRAFLHIVWDQGIRQPGVRLEWWRSVVDCLLHNPMAFRIAVSFSALYMHFGPYSRELAKLIEKRIEESPREEILQAREGATA